jgi:hypothetical protein
MPFDKLTTNGLNKLPFVLSPSTRLSLLERVPFAHGDALIAFLGLDPRPNPTFAIRF